MMIILTKEISNVTQKKINIKWNKENVKCYLEK